LLSSCSLVGLYVNLQVRVTEKKNDENFSKYFSGGFLKLKLRFADKSKVFKKNVGVVDVPLVRLHVVKHGLKFEEYFCDCEEERKK
jgi:hypothetical protein